MTDTNTKESTNKQCFVIMGFGTKTDLATGRKINLDNSYQALIKPVVTSKGLECIRADEIKHSGPIDVPMYQALLTADIVIADISTANTNAVYELGIRHALRPHTTIVISEKQLSYPFDLSHILITKYETLGENIDYFEVMRFQKLLGEMIDQLLETEKTDSPVYTFLDDLIPPSLQRTAERLTKKVNKALKEGKEEKEESASDDDSKTLSFIVQGAEEAYKARNFVAAKTFFKSAIELAKCNSLELNFNTNPYLIHRLAQATYKTKFPDEAAALREAIGILHQLDLDHTNDTETVALAGKIEKRLYYHGEGIQHLSNAILYFGRAFFLLHSRYHGINVAFLLNWRVDTSIYKKKEDKMADMIWANRTREDVLSLCSHDISMLKNREDSMIKEAEENKNPSSSGMSKKEEESYWIYINKAEAHFGLGQMEEYKKTDAKARVLNPPRWMLQGYEGQMKDLRIMMNKYGHLLNPPWTEPSE
jgi:hypothetical protein